MFLPLAYYKFSGLFNFLTCSFLGIFLLVKASHLTRNRIFAYLCFSIAYWNGLYFIWADMTDKIWSECLIRTIMFGPFYHPTLFFHFIVLFLNLPQYSKLVKFNYLFSFLIWAISQKWLPTTMCHGSGVA